MIVLFDEAINSVSNLKQLNHISITEREFDKVIMISQDCIRPANELWSHLQKWMEIFKSIRGRH